MSLSVCVCVACSYLTPTLSTALTHCQVFNMAASLVVLYSTFSRSEAERVAALQPVLKHLPLTDSVETKVK